MANSLVLPTIYTAIDKQSPVMRAMGNSVQRLATRTEANVERMNRSFSRLGMRAQSAYSKLNIFPKISSAAGMFGLSLGITGLTLGLKKFVTEASKIEDATAGFTPMLGSVDKARQLVDELNAAAAKTPFRFDNLASSANMLLGFGAATKDTVIPTLMMLGDIAQGDAQKLQGITLAYSQTVAAGKANMQDINQMINNGVPILGALAKMWGVNTGKAREMVSQGKATAKEITKAFKMMTGEGGMFYKGMEIASQTLTGQLSTLADNINLAFGAVGQAALPVLKEFVGEAINAAGRIREWVSANQDLIKSKVAEWAGKARSMISWLIENYDKIILFTKIYIGTLIALKAAQIGSTVAMVASKVAMVAYNVVLGISAALQGKSAFYTMGSTIAYGAYRTAIVLGTAAQWALNAAMWAFPGLLIIGIIALIVYWIVKVIKHTKGWGEQWDEIVKWMGNVFAAFKAGLLLHWQSMKHAFLYMVEAIVMAWKWGQNLLGKLSDEQYAKDIARIKAQRKERVAEMKQTAMDMAKASASALQGPKWKLRWESDQEGSGESGKVTPLNPKKAMAMAMHNVNVEGGTQNNVGITIKDESGRAKVTNNPGKIPIKTIPSVNGMF